MPLLMPESVHVYMTDRVAQTAVDTLLEGEKRPPDDDLGWDGLSDFHRAVLAAHQVRCEYAIHLSDLWDEIWKPRFEGDDGPRFTRQSITEAEAWCDQSFTPFGIWEAGWFGATFAQIGKPRTLCVGLYLEDAKSGVQLSAQLHGERDRELLRAEALGELWEEDDTVMLTASGLVPIGEQRSINLERLRDAAKAALEVVGNCA